MTSIDEFDKFIHLLPCVPYLIPIAKNSKHPDIPEGESWKAPKYKLTVEQARKRLGQGLNVGVAATGKDIVIFDLDNLQKYEFSKETLAVKTRSGKLHKYYMNGGDVKNADGKGQYAGCGEVRAQWKYVVAPGSYVPCDKNVSDGVYRVSIEKQPVLLNANELPPEFQPTPTTNPIQPLIMDGSFRNQYGWTIEDIRERDEKLDELLSNTNVGYPSASEADMATLAKLIYWGYTDNEASIILRKFRDREKLLRDDYINATLAKISRKDTIANHVNIRYWTPKEGHVNGQQTDSEAATKMKDVLKSLFEQFTFKTPTDIEEVYYYNDGVYEIAEPKIKGLIEAWLDAETTTHFVEEALNHIRRLSYVPREEFNKASKVIPVLNGLLNLTIMQLEPFDKEKIFTYKLNVNYNAEKKCPKFQKFLTEVLDVEDIPTLQEYLGYCLVPAMPYHKMMWFYGLGRNGKGRIIATLQAMLGVQNCSNQNLEEFYGDRRFSIAQLYGKMINVSSEPSVKRALESPLLKKITGEDFVDAEIKNKQHPIRFINFAKMFVLGNRFPRVNDNTIAFWDRIILIRFPYSFIGKKQIVDIEKAWINDEDERSGILNWMIEGLMRLLSNNEFTVGKTTGETTLEFKRASDTTMSFLDEQCEYKSDSEYTRLELYELYKEYCDNYGLIVDEERLFIPKIKQNPKVKTRQKRIDGKIERVWVGLRVKPIKPTEDLAKTEAHETHETPIFGSKILRETSESSCRIKSSELHVSGASCASDINEKLNSDGEPLVYQQLTCCFCEKAILDNEWIMDEFSWNRPAHKSCYDENKARVKETEKK